MAKEKRIIVDLGVKGKLLEIATYPTIRRALDGDISSLKKIKIREKAIELGGVIMYDASEKVVEAKHNSTGNIHRVELYSTFVYFVDEQRKESREAFDDFFTII